MTVKELIEILQRMRPECELHVLDQQYGEMSDQPLVEVEPWGPGGLEKCDGAALRA
jgi:hypothetical protein